MYWLWASLCIKTLGVLVAIVAALVIFFMIFIRIYEWLELVELGAYKLDAVFMVAAVTAALCIILVLCSGVAAQF